MYLCGSYCTVRGTCSYCKQQRWKTEIQVNFYVREVLLWRKEESGRQVDLSIR